MENRTNGEKRLPTNSMKEFIWTSNRTFQGWNCSQCEWNYPVPTLLNDPDAKTAYDRLALSKFKEHKCADFLMRAGGAYQDSFTGRIRKLISQGFKPKDAVELMLQEIALEYRNDPAALAQAKTEGDDFLRRLRAGLI